MPLDTDGNLVEQAPGAVDQGLTGSIAPPGYGEHTLDQLYEEMDTTGFQTPAIQSGVNSPFYVHSRAGSTENLTGIMNGAPAPFAPTALASRLANVSLDPTQRSTNFNQIYTSAPPVGQPSEPHSATLTRSNSGDDGSGSGAHSPTNINIDESEFAQLNKVPSYCTAVRTPASSRSQAETFSLPDYQTALHAPRTPPATEVFNSEILPSISEHASGGDHPTHPV